MEYENGIIRNIRLFIMSYNVLFVGQLGCGRLGRSVASSDLTV